MENVTILYHSRRGTTAAFANEIAGELASQGVKAEVLPLYRISEASFDQADTIFLGCWTSGLLFFFQKPEKIWLDYIRQMPDPGRREIVLFTTYKILTGSMFRQMERHLPSGSCVSRIVLKSRNGRLNGVHRNLISYLTAKRPERIN
jgi:flavodoxin